jgi:membrane protein
MIFEQLSNTIDDLLWRNDLEQTPSWQRAGIELVRLLYALGRDLSQGLLSLQAMSLVYTTLLSLVPLLAVSFSVLKGFGVHSALEPMLVQALEPLGPQAQEIANRLIGYVDKTDVGVLGSVGLVVLLYSVLSLIQKIEQVFNITWRVEQSRPFAQRFGQYLSVLLIGPVLFFSAVGATASLSSNALVKELLTVAPLGLLLEMTGRLVPYLLITAAFAFVYVFVPNTRVRFLPALTGALIAGLLWQGIGAMFAHFMAGSTRYAAIYSSLAILILFMIWVYIAWLILLVGSSIAFYVQYPEYLGTKSRDLRLSNRLRERLALTVSARIAWRFEQGEPALTEEALAHKLGMPSTNVIRVLKMLEHGGFITRNAETPPRFLPARSPDQIAVADLVTHIRRYEETVGGPRAGRPCPAVADLEQRIETALTGSLKGMSLRDLAAQIDATDQALVAPASVT